MRVDPKQQATSASVAAQVKAIGTNPSADELLGVMASHWGNASTKELQPIAKAASGALKRAFEKAAATKQPDMLGVYAEDAGKLMEIMRSLGTLTPKVTTRVGALFNRIVDLRVADLRALASPMPRSAAADSIANSDDVGLSLKLDLDRLPRYGLRRRDDIDVGALTFAVKRAAVDSFKR